MYSILMDAVTKSYYMEPGEIAFHAYSDPSKLDIRRKNNRLVETDLEDVKELETEMYNAGFFHGYLDGEKYIITKKNIYFYNRNPNDVVYAQWLLTNDNKYLAENLKKQKLFTLCKIDKDKVYFPTVKAEDGDRAVLTYTSINRIPTELFNKYEGWRCVEMTFDIKCIVNGSFIAE